MDFFFTGFCCLEAAETLSEWSTLYEPLFYVNQSTFSSSLGFEACMSFLFALQFLTCTAKKYFLYINPVMFLFAPRAGCEVPSM